MAESCAGSARSGRTQKYLQWKLINRHFTFVEKTFGARPVLANGRLDMSIPGEADLIFSGSLLTHFDEWQWDAILALWTGALAPDRTLVFTTHGRVTALQANKNSAFFGDLIAADDLYRKYKQDGFSFQPYASAYPEYGISLSSPEWVFRKLQKLPYLKIIAFEEQGWGQDVFGLRLNPWPLVV